MGGGAVGPESPRVGTNSPDARAIAEPKTFVLDTNVVLHDARCMDAFGSGDVAIPITVLEETDRFKRGSEDINAQAREFLRRLDSLTGDLLCTTGAPLGDGMGRVRVVLGGGLSGKMRETLLQDSPDHRILATALQIAEEQPGRRVVFVSKDVNLRMKAKSFGLVAQDYTRDKVKEPAQLRAGRRLVENMPAETIERFYANGGHVAAEHLPEVDAPVANESFVLRNGSKSALATYHAPAQEFRRVDKATAFGLTPRNAEQSFALDVLMNEEIRLVTLAGKAGTGKTILALAAALEQRRSYRQIMLARPVVALSNRDLGYLPGDIGEKLDPYMQPLFDNLSVLKHLNGEDQARAERIREMQEAGKLIVTPLAYIRGRTLPHVYFIVDEAQNLSPHEIKTIITRAGEGTKIVFTGDIQQIDQPYLDEASNGLSYVISRMRDQAIYAHVSLEKGERSPLADLASDLL